MTKNLKQQDDLWVPCPAGAIQKVADAGMVSRCSVANPEKRKFMASAMAAAAGVVVLGGVGYLATRDGQPGGGGNSPVTSGAPMASNWNFGGINCREVLGLAKDYHCDAIAEEKLAKIVAHLKVCSKCRMHYESIGC